MAPMQYDQLTLRKHWTLPVAPRTNTLRGDRMVQLSGQGRHVMGQAQGLSRVKLSLLLLSCKSSIMPGADVVQACKCKPCALAAVLLSVKDSIVFQATVAGQVESTMLLQVAGTCLSCGLRSCIPWH